MGNIESNNRILYVEPNDIYGQVSNQPMTPDYTDYCIYCNLIVEKTSRLRNSYAGTNSTGAVSVEANYGEGEKGVLYTSFFQGESKQYNYLTTDYTNIHFNSIKERTFVEGLQITGIDINYANRMAPTVAIQMVDIRGAGLFGREEAVHVNGGYDLSKFERNEEDAIIDNIYSGFMSFPYPKYRLHIKGYYGRAVTYQLTCSNFTGKFDSNTGNFNITATFIGYEFGCLQDLPLSYVMAAPLTRTGRKYWNKMRYSDEWNLFIKQGYGQEAPMLMHDFFRNIKSAIDNKAKGESLNDKIVDTSLEDISKEYNQKNTLITNIQDVYTNFIKQIKIDNPDLKDDIIEIDDDSRDGDKIVVIFSSKSAINISNGCANYYNTIGDSLEKYGRSFPNDNIGIGNIPCMENVNWNSSTEWAQRIITLPRFLKKYERKLVAISTNQFEKQLHMSDGEEDLNDPKVKMGILNTKSGYSFNSKQSYTIFSHIKKRNSEAQKPYASVIVFKKYRRLASLLSELETKLEEYKNKIEDGQLVSITRITANPGSNDGISPYIGNYYKMVFCHVDTFIHTLWACVDDIYKQIPEGDREPTKLGVYSNKMTDIPNDIYNPGINKGVIPPFPGIYKNYDSDEISVTESVNDTTKTIGWVGDVKGSVPWREQTLVEEYYSALRHIDFTVDDVPWTDVDDKELKFNLLPCFIANDIDTKLFTTRDGMAYYVAIVSELILGAMNNVVITDEEAETIGAILAKNIFDGCEDKQKLLNTVSGDSLAKDLYNISTISDVSGNDEAKRFEFASGSSYDKKHRIFTHNSRHNEYLNYVYMLSNTGYPVIPLNSFNDWADLPKQYNFINGSDGSSFVPKTVIDGPYAITERAHNFVESISNVTDNEYMNSYMFSIWLDACNVETIENGLNEYKTGGSDIGKCKKEKIKKYILERYWLMGDNFKNYQTETPEKMVKNSIEVPDDITEDIKKKFLKLDY